jgi:DNA processing protein
VSQYAPSFCAQPWTFVRRNATVAALAEAVVVVEAGAVSGALITAEDARRLGRPLFAVPGPLGSAASVGTNALIASGAAKALLGASALLEALGQPALAAMAKPSDPVLEALASGPLDFDSLARRAGRGRAATETALATHLLDGSVVMTRDGLYRRP